MTRQHGVSHKKAAQIHALRRARERFNAGPELLKALRRVFKKRHSKVVDVRDGRKIIVNTGEDYVQLGSYSDGRVEAIIILEGTRYRAIYNTRLKTIVTVIAADPVKKEVCHEAVAPPHQKKPNAAGSGPSPSLTQKA